MRVLYLSADPGVPVLGHKGASIHVRELARALGEAGADVTIASPRVGEEGAPVEWSGALAWIPPVLPKKHTHAQTLLAAMEAQTRW